MQTIHRLHAGLPNASNKDSFRLFEFSQIDLAKGSKRQRRYKKSTTRHTKQVIKHKERRASDKTPMVRKVWRERRNEPEKKEYKPGSRALRRKVQRGVVQVQLETKVSKVRGGGVVKTFWRL